MSTIETIDQLFPEFVEIFIRFNEINNDGLLTQRHTVYLLCFIFAAYLMGWMLQYDQFHQLPYVSIEPENENTSPHPYSIFGVVWALTLYVALELLFYVIEGQPFIFTLSLLRTMLSYSILFITVGTILTIVYIGYFIFTRTISNDR